MLFRMEKLYKHDYIPRYIYEIEVSIQQMQTFFRKKQKGAESLSVVHVFFTLAINSTLSNQLKEQSMYISIYSEVL